MVDERARLRESRGYKFKEIKHDVKIAGNGHFELTIEANPVSLTMRLAEIEHQLICEPTPEKGKLTKPRIEYLSGAEIWKGPKIVKDNQKSYIYVIPKTPLGLGEKTKYRLVQRSNFQVFFMNLTQVKKKRAEPVPRYFEYFSYLATRDVDDLLIKVTLPAGFLRSIKDFIEGPVFCKATPGDVYTTASDPDETRKMIEGLDIDFKNDIISTHVNNLVYSMHYAVCWYLPDKELFMKTCRSR